MILRVARARLFGASCLPFLKHGHTFSIRIKICHIAVRAERPASIWSPSWQDLGRLETATLAKAIAALMAEATHTVVLSIALVLLRRWSRAF